MRRLTWLLLLTGTALVLSGCIKMTVDLSVSANDRISGSVVLAIHEEVRAMQGALADDTDTLFLKTDQIEVKPYSDGKFVGTEYIFKNAPLSAFAPSTEQSADALAIQRRGDQLVVSGVIDLSTDGYSDDGSSDLFDWMFSDSEIRISIELPGEINSANGDIDGNRITWVAKLQDRVELNAVATAPYDESAPLPIVPILGGLGLAVSAGAGAAVAARHMRARRNAIQPFDEFE